MLAVVVVMALFGVIDEQMVCHEYSFAPGTRVAAKSTRILEPNLNQKIEKLRYCE